MRHPIVGIPMLSELVLYSGQWMAVGQRERALFLPTDVTRPTDYAVVRRRRTTLRIHQKTYVINASRHSAYDKPMTPSQKCNASYLLHTLSLSDPTRHTCTTAVLFPICCSSHGKPIAPKMAIHSL